MKILISEKQYETIKKKRSNNEISIELLKEANDLLSEALRVVEAATQFSNQDNSQEAIEELIGIRRDIACGANKVWNCPDPDSANIVGRINKVIEMLENENIDY